MNFRYHDCQVFIQWIKRILQTPRKYINNSCSTSEPEFIPSFSDVRVAWSLVLCALIGRSLFVLFYFFFWPLCCLSFDLRILITPLVSTNSSFLTTIKCNWYLSQALVARSHHPLFSNFLFTNLFSIKFLYFFIISSLFPYFNLFVSIFIQSYVNIKLHVSTLYRY